MPSAFALVLPTLAEPLRFSPAEMVVLAALCLVLDFDMVEQGVRNGIPQRYAWTAAFGLTVTLVWLYIEFLRILSVLRSMAGD